jgi:three-Cys-motif partner protein
MIGLFPVDDIGPWSELKLEIVRDYATRYSQILTGSHGLEHIYIDAFAGTGVHLSRSTGALIPGSPINALRVEPPFREYHLIDVVGDRVAALRARIGTERSDVHVHEGDCNEILLKQILPSVTRQRGRRALCLLDPYGLHLKWEVIRLAGQLQTVEIFLNFPTMDMNRNALWRNPEKVPPAERARMTTFWGDESWRSVAYDTRGSLFGYEEKSDNETIAEAFRHRLVEVAGFAHVPAPLAMRMSTRATLYYLFFATSHSKGAQIVNGMFAKHRRSA